MKPWRARVEIRHESFLLFERYSNIGAHGQVPGHAENNEPKLDPEMRFREKLHSNPPPPPLGKKPLNNRAVLGLEHFLAFGFARKRQTKQHKHSCFLVPQTKALKWKVSVETNEQIKLFIEGYFSE